MNILLIEDEMRVADFIRRGLKSEGWPTEHATDGETALELLRDHDYDVIVLDLMLPGISGLDVCQKMRVRKDFTPVLMLTALDSTDERIAGLRLGADDYLPKPFDFEELLARIQALHRRSIAFQNGASDDHLSFRGLVLNRESMQFFVDGKEIYLSSTELGLLTLFLSNPDKLLSRERILNAIWGTQEDPMTNIVDVYVGRLRKKIGQYGNHISTVRGTGYRFG